MMAHTSSYRAELLDSHKRSNRRSHNSVIQWADKADYGILGRAGDCALQHAYRHNSLSSTIEKPGVAVERAPLLLGGSTSASVFGV